MHAARAERARAHQPQPAARGPAQRRAPFSRRHGAVAARRRKRRALLRRAALPGHAPGHLRAPLELQPLGGKPLRARAPAAGRSGAGHAPVVFPLTAHR
jgi:hypothetical protein